jgi:hypothetical protein
MRFAFRFVILLAAVPVIMFTELTRKEKGTVEQKHNVEKVIASQTDEAMLNNSPFMQAVNN